MFLLSAAWFFDDPGYEPILVAIGSFTALLLTFWPEPSSSPSAPQSRTYTKYSSSKYSFYKKLYILYVAPHIQIQKIGSRVLFDKKKSSTIVSREEEGLKSNSSLVGSCPTTVQSC
jgi:hypothetical protein